MISDVILTIEHRFLLSKIIKKIKIFCHLCYEKFQSPANILMYSFIFFDKNNILF